MTVIKRNFVIAACAAMIFTVGRPSSAATITGTDSDFSIAWSLACGGAGTCAGTADFDVTTFNATTLVLDVTVNNGPLAAGEFLESLGWNVDPAATGGSFTQAGTFLDDLTFDVNSPQFGTLNVCVQNNASPGSCGSGQPNGIPGSTSDNFIVSLTGNFGSSVNLDTFGLKYSGEFGSFEPGGSETTGSDTTGSDTTGSDTTGSDTTGSDTTGGEVPEPASLLLLGSGLAGAALRFRRNRK